MKLVEVNGVELAYQSVGEGDTVLLVHGSNLADGLGPLAAGLATRLPDRRILRYHRRGMGRSSGRDSRIGVERDARDCLGLLDALEIESAHVLGYSYGGVVALEAALTAPARISSLILLEPILIEVPSAGEFMDAMAPVMTYYRTGDMAAAVTATFAGLGGPQWRDLLDTVGADAVEHAITDTEVFYQAEAPSLANWTLAGHRRRDFDGPILSVVGVNSGPFFGEGRQLLHRHFTRCRDADIDNANHLLNLQAPHHIAAVTSRFILAKDPTRLG